MYGFTGKPYRLHVFITPRIFALEFMRQRLCAEEDHFRAFKKSSNIKFPLKVGPFIFKNKSALLIVEKLLEIMDFQKEKRINYDPHHIISQRKQSNKNKPFDHQVVEGLEEVANLSCFVESLGIDESRSSELITTVQALENPRILTKRSLSEIENMDVDENSSCKKTKTLSQDDQVSSEIVAEDLKKIVLFTKKSVQLNDFSFGGENSA